MPAKDIGKTLKEYRKLAQISVNEISNILTQKGFKASTKTIYSWESGRSEPSPDALLAMCRAYKIDDVLAAFGYDGYDEDGALILNITEVDIIEKYRCLDNSGKETVTSVLDIQYNRCTNNTTDERCTVSDNVVAYKTPILNAAHERTDIEVTDEMRQHDEDIMDDENF